MNIVFLKSRLSFKGGLEKYTLQLASRFAQNGHHVTVLTTGDVPSQPNINIVSLSKNSKWTLFHLLRFDYLCTKWLKKHPADVIFGMERNRHQTHYRAGSGVHAAFLQRRFQMVSFLKKLSIIFNPLHLYILYAEKRAFENPKLQRLFVNSEMVKKEILTHYKIDPNKIDVVHNGVSWKERESDFKYFAKERAPLRLLFVGNGYQRKGLGLLLPVLATLKNYDFHLSVVGKDKNIIYFEELVKKQGLKDKVTFHGMVDHLTAYYQNSDVLILPTLYDPFANVTLEALAMGLFVVTSQANGACEILNETSGYIIKNLTDFEEIKQGVLKGFQKPKTYESALIIRKSIQDLEFSRQLDKIVAKTFSS